MSYRLDPAMPPPPGPAILRRVLGPLDGGRIPGGCDHCNAFQTVVPLRAGVWLLTVHHDDSCAWLARREGADS